MLSDFLYLLHSIYESVYTDIYIHDILASNHLAMHQIKKQPAFNFSECYANNVDSAYRYAYTLTQDRALAEDLTAQAFLTLLEKQDTLQVSHETVKYWLFRTIKNHNSNRMRKKQEETMESDCEVASDDESIEAIAIAKADIKLVSTYLQNLSPTEREIITLRLWEDMSYNDISDQLGIPADTARVKYRRAIQKLTKQLQGTKKRAITPELVITGLLACRDAKAHKLPLFLHTSTFLKIYKNPVLKYLPLTLTRLGSLLNMRRLPALTIMTCFILLLLTYPTMLPQGIREVASTTHTPHKNDLTLSASINLSPEPARSPQTPNITEITPEPLPQTKPPVSQKNNNTISQPSQHNQPNQHHSPHSPENETAESGQDPEPAYLEYQDEETRITFQYPSRLNVIKNTTASEITFSISNGADKLIISRKPSPVQPLQPSSITSEQILSTSTGKTVVKVVRSHVTPSTEIRYTTLHTDNPSFPQGYYTSGFPLNGAWEVGIDTTTQHEPKPMLEEIVKSLRHN